MHLPHLLMLDLPIFLHFPHVGAVLHTLHTLRLGLELLHGMQKALPLTMSWVPAISITSSKVEAHPSHQLSVRLPQSTHGLPSSSLAALHPDISSLFVCGCVLACVTCGWVSWQFCWFGLLVCSTLIWWLGVGIGSGVRILYFDLGGSLFLWRCLFDV